MQQTLSIIKPDVVKKGVIGKIVDRFESNGLRIAAMKKVKLSKCDAKAFYAVHKDRPFFNDLVLSLVVEDVELGGETAAELLQDE